MWSRMEAWLRSPRQQPSISHCQQGQGLVEYAMILILAVVMVIILLTLFAPWLNNTYLNVISVL